MWHVLVTFPNRESTANKHLHRLGCDAYLPSFPKAKFRQVRGGRRWRVWRRPIFPGYVFVRSAPDLALRVYMAAGVRYFDPFLRFNGRVVSLDETTMAQIRVIEHEQANRQRLRFRVGDRVTVSEGPFTGLRATVHMLTDRERVTLLLDFLGQQTRVDVAASAIEGAAV